MKSEEDLSMEIAAFRFSLIADFVNGTPMLHGQKQRLFREISQKRHRIPGSNRTSVSIGTLRAWIARYVMSGRRIESLIPRARSDRGRYRRLDDGLRRAIKDLKKENPTYTLPVMIAILKQRGLVDKDARLNHTTIYRFMKAENINDAVKADTDRRAFEAAYPNEIWQCDVLHGPSARREDGSFRKTYLFAIIDDHSRLVTHAAFFHNETFDSLKTTLREAVMKRGLPRRFYVDNGACYRSSNLEFILASLGIALTHSRPYCPQGRGKIERFFRNVRQNFFPLHVPKPLTLVEMNERLEVWLDQYHETIHSTTKMTPYERFRKSLSCVRPAPDRILDYFRHVERRKVRRDRTIQMFGKVYEVPLGLMDKTVELRFHPDHLEKIEVFHDSHSFGMALLLDKTVNARVGRVRLDPPSPKTDESLSIPDDIDSGELF